MSESILRTWHIAERRPVIEPNEVHVWLVDLDVPAETIKRYWQIISSEEQDRANRFHFPKDREHFIVAHGVLRKILGYYLNSSPKDLCFMQNSCGKPFLTEDKGASHIMFNLSHSHGLALIAAAYKRKIGVDIEWKRDDLASQQIAERFFSPKEVEELLSLEKRLQKTAFFNCWTRKEAYIKARGEGLSIPLHEFDVTLAPDKPAKLLASRVTPDEASSWSMHAVEIDNDHAAAVVVEGNGYQIKCWKWAEESLIGD